MHEFMKYLYKLHVSWVTTEHDRHDNAQSDDQLAKKIKRQHYASTVYVYHR